MCCVVAFGGSLVPHFFLVSRKLDGGFNFFFQNFIPIWGNDPNLTNVFEMG